MLGRTWSICSPILWIRVRSSGVISPCPTIARSIRIVRGSEMGGIKSRRPNVNSAEPHDDTAPAALRASSLEIGLNAPMSRLSAPDGGGGGGGGGGRDGAADPVRRPLAGGDGGAGTCIVPAMRVLDTSPPV